MKLIKFSVYTWSGQFIQELHGLSIMLVGRYCQESRPPHSSMLWWAYSTDGKTWHTALWSGGTASTSPLDPSRCSKRTRSGLGLHCLLSHIWSLGWSLTRDWLSARGAYSAHWCWHLRSCLQSVWGLCPGTHRASLLGSSESWAEWTFH